MPATLPAEDLPPAPATHRVPRGLLVAAVLATVVFAVACLAALRAGPTQGGAASGVTSESALPVNRLNAGAGVVGQPLPDLAFERFDGSRAKLSDYRGRPLIINFWSSTCAPCLQEMPAFEQVHAEVAGRVGFLGMDVTDSVENGQAMAARTGVRYDLGRDPTGDILTALGGAVLPTTVVVGSDGIVRTVHVGAWSADDLRAAVAGTG